MTLYLTSFLTKTFDRLLPLLEEAVPGKSICYVPTAADVERNKGYILETVAELIRHGFDLQILDIVQMDQLEIEQALTNCNCLMVSGGNTFYLLQELQQKKLLPLIRTKVQTGMIYVGESAGSILAAPDIFYSCAMDQPERAPQLHGTTALGLINFYPVPHVGEEYFASAAEQICCEYKDTVELVCINNYQFIVVNETGYRVL